MRKSYLEAYYNLIPMSQQNRLLSVIKSRFDAASQDPSDADMTSQLVVLIAQLKKPLGNPLVQLRKAMRYGKIISKNYNDTMDEVYVDLGSLFKQNNLINKTIIVHESLNDSSLTDIRSALAKIENDIVVHKVIKENKTGITDVKYNTFFKKDNKSIDAVYGAQVDTDTNSLKLPMGLNQSSLGIQGVVMAEIDVQNFGGGIRGMIEDESHTKEKAIDESMSTFWGEVLLTDEPIRQIYDGNTEFGAICEVVISLFRSDMVNHIKIRPFTNYPLRVMKVMYSSTKDGSWIDLNVGDISSTNDMEFNFSEVLVKRVKIVFNQKNPSVNTYRIPKRVINNAQMWQQIADREYSISTDTSVPIQATQDMIDYVSGWKAYVNAANSFGDRIKALGQPVKYELTNNMSESIFDAATQEMTKAGNGTEADSLKLDLYRKKPDVETETVEVRKYEYVYGAYNIDIRKIWYMDSGEYISPVYIPNGAVVEARLDVTETVPSGTSIEYQVATRSNEWKNILPSGGYISKERLDLNPITQSGFIRFPCATTLDAVYRNDAQLPGADWTFNNSTSQVVVGSGWYSATSSFTTSYQPKGVGDIIPSGVVVSFLDDTLQAADETTTVTKSRQYKVLLQHYPYINYFILNDTSDGKTSSPNFVYEEGRWQNMSGNTVRGILPLEYYDVLYVTVDGFPAMNGTDYYEDIRPALTQYDEVVYPYFEYIHSGKNIYFNTPINGREIKAKYSYLNDFIQFRALLRNNNRGNVSRTPVLEDFTLKLRTI